MALQALRGFRDFYPEDQANINFLKQKIAAVCDLFGYEEIEGPAVEPLELYAAKSSDEIVNEQAFVFTDRGGEKVALRPELTPTLARMVAARQNQLTFPLRWWSFGRFWRYERPQKGRGREFYQWNCDLLGVDSVEADMEIIEIVIAFLSSLGLTPSDCVIEISDRGFLNQQLSQLGFGEAERAAVFKYLDKAPKLTSDEQDKLAQQLGIRRDQIEAAFLAPDAWKQAERLVALVDALKAKGLAAWVKPNLAIVRGFTYYTGMVFEASDRDKKYRAMIGGGRYGDLVSQVGGQPVSGIGFGMGDMVLTNFLAEKGLLPEYTPNVCACIIGLGEQSLGPAQRMVTQLRDQAIPVIFFGITDNPGKGLKFANQKRIPFAILIGDAEIESGTVTLKNLETGEQESLAPDDLPSRITKQE